MRLLAIFLLSVCAQAAVVEGVVLDEETGNPLARTQVSLVPLPGTPAEVTGVRTAARGSFVILSVRPGWYVLRVTRRGYAPAEYGQSRPGRPGHAFEVADNRASNFLEIHMSHMAAVTGTVLDENGIGMPHWTVHIYSSQKPMRHVAQVETDDRGDYRIGELDPGVYLLRSGPGRLEDEQSLLATYSKAAVELKDAWSTSVRVGQTQANVIIRPVKGRLFTLSGMFLPPPFPGAATLTLISDTGRRQLAFSNMTRPFSANDVQPGPVEFLVTGNDGFGNSCGSDTQLVVDKDLSTLRLACNPIGKGGIQVSGAMPKSPLLVRRVDLDGVSDSHPLTRDELFIPGHWEFSVPPGDYYVQSVRSYGRPAPQSGAWYGFEAGTYTNVSVSLSTRTSTISGVVSTKGNPVSGAPVYLVQSTSGQTWTVRSDPQGNYSIGGLGPGTYSILSSFELDQIDGASRLADAVTTSDGNTTVQALELILP